METFCAFMIFVCLFSKSSAYHLSDSEAGRTAASTLVKEGLPAEIICMVEGTGHYFWRKGESFNNSTLVASSTGDNGNKDNEPYVVTVNGTLFIKKVTLKDEGKYFCRVTSVENECHGQINVIVQASLSNFFLAIDRCDRESSCLLYLNPSQSISLTCTAHNAPPLMTLKWFNGSKEITEGIEQNEILPQNGKREMTSTVAAVYGHPASLTCQAVDPKRSNDDVRFAHAQVEMTVPVNETLPSWIIVAVTLAGCFIFFGIAFLIKATVNRKQRKKYKNLSSQRYTSLQEGENEEISRLKKEQNEEISRLKKEQNEEISKLKKEQHEEISRLKDKLGKTEEELKKSRNDNIDLQTKTANDEAKITYAEESAKTKNQEIANTDQELTNLKTKLQQRDEEIKKEKNENLELQKKIANIEATLTATKEIAKTKDQELTDLKSKLPDQIQEMSTLKGDLESKAKSIAELEDKLKQQEEEINKERNANIKLQETIASAKGETTVAEDLVERRNKEISELKETVEQKDKEINNQLEKFLDCQTNLQREQIASQGKSDDISKLKDKLKQQEEEINKERNANIELQITSAIAATETTVVEELAERRNKEISELKKKVEQKEKEVNNQREKYSDCQTNLQKKEIDLQRKSFEISDLKEKFTKLEELYKNLKSAEKGSHK